MNLEMGKRNEIICHPFTEHISGEKMTKTPGDFDEIDFEGDTSWFEIKSRTTASDHFNTTIFGSNKVPKICELIKKGKRVWFGFLFTDGFFYIRVDKRFMYYEDKPLGWIARGEMKGNHIHIPIKDLIKFAQYKQERVCRFDRGEEVAVRHLHIPCSDLD